VACKEIILNNLHANKAEGERGFKDVKKGNS
jgi:hypothetical protein